MMEGVLVALAAVLTGLLTYVGVRYTARANRQAAEYTAWLAAPEHISAGYDRLNDDLWKQVTDARAEARSAHGRYRAAVAYIRHLLSLLTLHAPHVPLPEPPPELADDVRVDRKDPP